MVKTSCSSATCYPAVIYAVIATIGILLNFLRQQFSISNLIYSTGTQVLFVALWTYLLYWLCKKCMGTVAWIVLLAPFILGLIFVFLIPLAVDLINGQPLNLSGRLNDVVGLAENSVSSIMQQQPAQNDAVIRGSDLLKQDSETAQQLGNLALSNVATISGGAAASGGYNIPTGMSGYGAY